MQLNPLLAALIDENGGLDLGAPVILGGGVKVIGSWLTWVAGLPAGEPGGAGGEPLTDGTTTRWEYVADYNYVRIRGPQCEITVEKRPPYCDRGQVLAKLQVFNRGNPQPLEVDYVDGWDPGRYYFSIENAISEVEAWMRARKQWAP